MAEVGMKDEEVMAPEEIDELILGGIAGSLATSIGCSSWSICWWEWCGGSRWWWCECPDVTTGMGTISAVTGMADDLKKWTIIKIYFLYWMIILSPEKALLILQPYTLKIKESLCLTKCTQFLWFSLTYLYREKKKYYNMKWKMLYTIHK